MSNSEPTSRRIFLKQVTGASGALGVGAAVALLPAGVALTASPNNAAAQSTPPAEADTAYVSLSPDEAAFTEALVNVMCPADELTPSGVDCGLALYIDRQLAGAFGKGAKRYARGPWRQGKPQHGYQLPLTPEQYFKTGVAAAETACKSRFGKSFDQLSTGDADRFLQDVADGKVSDPELNLASWFGELVYPLFNQACFADPIYGGNRGKVFWKLIGYPGLPATNAINMVQYRGKPFPGAQNPKSIADFS